MNKGQTRGMIVIVIGFVITIIAGIVLSFITTDLLTATQTLIAALLVFLIIAPIVGFGIFTYARSTEREALETNEEMEKPRLLLDILREEGQADVMKLAEQLNTTPAEIKSYIEDLSQLALFSGIADWDNGVIALFNPMVVQAIDTCKTCKNAITIQSNLTICENCGTEYHKF